ncbi:MAG: hypothetical protein AAGI38_04030 [Bacteroidota bacterium]
MGAYLAFGLNYRATVSHRQLQQSGWDEAQLLQKIEKTFGFPAENYMQVSTKDEVTWDLRPEVIEQQLIPLLEKVYPVMYPNADRLAPFWKQLTQELATISPESLIEWAESSEENWSFRIEGYADEWYRLRGPSQEEVVLSLYHIRLMMEGKFFMEEGRKSFNFIQHCISRAFPDLSLSRSLRIYVM